MKMGSCASSDCGWKRMGQRRLQLWKRPMYGQPTVMLSVPRPSCWAKTPLRFSSEVIAWVPLRPHPLMSKLVDPPADGRAGNGRCDASRKCAAPNFRSKETAGVESMSVAPRARTARGRGSPVAEGCKNTDDNHGSKSYLQLTELNRAAAKLLTSSVPITCTLATITPHKPPPPLLARHLSASYRNAHAARARRCERCETTPHALHCPELVP